MGIQKEVGSWMAAGGSHEGACRQGSVVAAGRAVLCFSCFPGRTELVPSFLSWYRECAR